MKTATTALYLIWFGFWDGLEIQALPWWGGIAGIVAMRHHTRLQHCIPRAPESLPVSAVLLLGGVNMPAGHGTDQSSIPHTSSLMIQSMGDFQAAAWVPVLKSVSGAPCPTCRQLLQRQQLFPVPETVGGFLWVLSSPVLPELWTPLLP